MAKGKSGDVAVTRETPIDTSKDIVNHAAKTAKRIDCEYSVVDLISAARSSFGVPPEIVSAAMKIAGKDKATIDEAKQIIKEFKERKVR